MAGQVPRKATPRKQSPTIYDVAELAGVSPSTVSRALNKPGRINANTEKRIRETAATVGYRLNPMARALPTGKTSTVGLILSDITNPVYFDLIRGAERIAAAGGYTLVLTESQESALNEHDIAQRLQLSVDGLVLVGSRLDDATIVELSESRPVVVVNRVVPGVSSAVADATPGLEAALEHLRALGHTSVGYLSGPAASWMNRFRWETLLDRAIAYGLQIVELPSGHPTLDGGRNALKRVLASGVTAIITYNDLMAMGLLTACRDAGLGVPDRLSIVGFDDIFGADLITPTLTTVRSPLAAVGERAMRLLLGEIEGNDGELEGELATTFVGRASTGAVNRTVTAGASRGHSAS